MQEEHTSYYQEMRALLILSLMQFRCFSAATFDVTLGNYAESLSSALIEIEGYFFRACIMLDLSILDEEALIERKSYGSSSGS